MRKWLVVIVLLVAAGLWFGGADRLAEYRVGVGLRAAGVSEKTSRCMARRMVKRLTYAQLWKLQSFEGEKHSLSDYLDAVDRVGDGKVIAVTGSSAALCATGLAH